MMAREEKLRKKSDIAEANCVDMFSKLPDELIHHILSFLTTKDLIATRILAKTWLCFTPILYFASTVDSYSEYQEFLQSLSKQLVKRQLVSIDLRYVSNKFDQSIEDFISLITKNNVYQLSFRGPNYSLPQTIFYSKSLVVLRLDGCSLNYPRYSTMTGRLDSLQVLSLTEVSFSGWDLKQLAFICPNIAHLSLTDRTSKMPRLLDLSDFKRLENVKVRGAYCHEIVTDAPNLRYLEFSSQCTIPCDISLRCCRKLEILKLNTKGCPVLTMTDVFFNCPLLEYVICNSYLTRRARFSNKSIGVYLSVDTPKRYSFEDFISGFMFSMKSEPQQKVRLEAKRKVTIGASSLEKLRGLVVKFTQISVLSFRFHDILLTEGVNIEHLRNNCKGPVPHIKHVKLELNSVYPGKNLIDAFLWCCYPETVTIKLSGNKNMFIEALNDTLLKYRLERMKTCCKETHVKCWRHFLKDVQMERCKRTDNQGETIVIRFQWSQL